MKFMKRWLVDHIVHNDYAFRDFMARKKGWMEDGGGSGAGGRAAMSLRQFAGDSSA